MPKDPGWSPARSQLFASRIGVYGCEGSEESVMERASAAVAEAAHRFMYTLDHPFASSENLLSAALLDYSFNGALSYANNATKNRAMLRNTFDLMSRGAAVNPANSREWAQVRIGCLSWRQAQAVFNKSSVVADCSPESAAAWVTPVFFDVLEKWKYLRKEDGIKMCGDKWFDDHLVAVMVVAHVFVHAVGVRP